MQLYAANLQRHLQFMQTYFANDKWAETPATSRHTSHSLRLLPSGPDRVHELLLREDQGLHRFFFLSLAKKWGDYQAYAAPLQEQNTPFEPDCLVISQLNDNLSNILVFFDTLNDVVSHPCRAQ